MHVELESSADAELAEATAGYPAAFKASDRAEIEKCDAQWAVIEAKTKKYVAVLGGTWIDPKCAAAGGKTQPRGR